MLFDYVSFFLKYTRKETAAVLLPKHQEVASNDTVDNADTLNNPYQSVLTEDNRTEMSVM